MESEKILKRLRQFPFYVEVELEDFTYLLPVLFSGTVRLFLQNNLVRAAIIVCDKLSYTMPSSINVNYEEVESIFKEHLWSGPESIQGFITQYQLVEVF
jgi:hypothetical protein